MSETKDVFAAIMGDEEKKCALPGGEYSDASKSREIQDASKQVSYTDRLIK